jgi:hypothetical protein
LFSALGKYVKSAFKVDFTYSPAAMRRGETSKWIKSSLKYFFDFSISYWRWSLSMAVVSGFKTAEGFFKSRGAHRDANITTGGAYVPWTRRRRSWQAPNKNIPPTPKPMLSKTKKDGGGDGRMAEVSPCGSNFIYTRAVLMESEVV